MIKHWITGNYELSTRFSGITSNTHARILFSADEDMQSLAFLDVTSNVFAIGREISGTRRVWKTGDVTTADAWEIRLLKKGSFYRFSINESASWMRGPLGEWEGITEPWHALIAIQVDGGHIDTSELTPLPWFPETDVVIPVGPKGSFMEGHVIPGAIIQHQEKYYMYIMASMKGEQEGGSRRTIGVASSVDLLHWEVHRTPIIDTSNIPGDNLYPNGAVVTPEGKIALMYAVQSFPEWVGFCLATADHPLGPFIQYPNNPVYRHFTHAHEFDLVRVDEPDARYMLMYSGFTPQPARGPAGDRGWLLYSNNLIDWRSDRNNPVFSPQTLNDWDAVHVRPRSLHRIGDTWYLWYEGCNNWVPPDTSHHGWWDTVGLARSRDLLRWEYYPYNPALSSGCSKWIGWPRMVIRDGVGYVFFVDGDSVALRRIPLEQLTEWSAEEKTRVNLLAEDQRAV